MRETKDGELKVGMVIDSYKIDRKDELFKEAEEKAKNQLRGKTLVAEEIREDSPFIGTTSIFRWYL